MTAPFIPYGPGSFLRADAAGAPIDAALTTAFHNFMTGPAVALGQTVAYPQITGTGTSKWGTVFAQGTVSDPVWHFQGTQGNGGALTDLLGAGGAGFHAPEWIADVLTGTSDSPLLVQDLASGFTVHAGQVSVANRSTHLLNANTWQIMWHSSNGLDGRSLSPFSDATDDGNWTSRGRILESLAIRKDCMDWAVANNTGLGYVLELFLVETLTSAGFCHPMVDCETGKLNGWGAEGLRLVIDPAIDLTTRGLSATGLALARTLQQHGCYIGDNSGSSSKLHAEQDDATYHAVWGTSLPADVLSGITWADFQVVEAGWQKQESAAVTYGPVGVHGGGLMQGLATDGSGKWIGYSDTQGTYFDDSATVGDNWRVRNTGIGAVDSYRQVADVLYSATETTTWYAATDGGLLASADDGLHWALRSPAVTFWGNGAQGTVIDTSNDRRPAGRLLVDEAGFLFAATAAGGIKRSTDHGATWVTANMAGAAPGGNYFARCLAQDPATPTTYYAGFIDHKAAPAGYGGLWRCQTAHIASPSLPNFTQIAGLAVPCVEDIVVMPAITGPPAAPQRIYCACATSGVWMASTANMTSWTNIGTVTPAAGTALPAGSVWMSIDVVADGSGNHVVLAACSSPADANNSAVWKIVVNASTGAVTSRAALATKNTVTTATIAPSGIAYWNAGAGLLLGGAGFQNPCVRFDPADATHQKIYLAGSQGFYRSTNGGSSWALANQGCPQFLGRELVTDPARPGWGGAASSDNGAVFWDNGDGSGTGHVVQQMSGSSVTYGTGPVTAAAKQAYAFAVDPAGVASRQVYLGAGEKYGGTPRLGNVYHASATAWPPAAWAEVGTARASDYATALGHDGDGDAPAPLGLLAMADPGTGTGTKVGLTVPISAFDAGPPASFAAGKTQEEADTWCVGAAGGRGLLGGDGLLHPPVTKRFWFAGAGQWTYSLAANDMATYKANGTYVIACLFPAVNGTAPNQDSDGWVAANPGGDYTVDGVGGAASCKADAISDKASIASFLSAMAAAGWKSTDCEIVFWQEPKNNLSIGQWNVMLRTYGGVVNASTAADGLPFKLCANLNGGTMGATPTWMRAALGAGPDIWGQSPRKNGLPRIDLMAVDYYLANSPSNPCEAVEAATGDTVSKLADGLGSNAGGTPVNLTFNEVGNNPHAAPLPTGQKYDLMADCVAHMQTVHDWVLARRTAPGGAPRHLNWWTANNWADGHDQVSSPIGLNPAYQTGGLPDPAKDLRIGGFQSWYDDLSSAPGEKVLIAATWGAGVWRNRQVAGVWQGWARASAPAGCCTSGQVRYHVPMVTGPGPSGTVIAYLYDPKTGLYSSSDAGATWRLAGAWASADPLSCTIAAHPAHVGEVWLSQAGTLYKVTSAHQGTAARAASGPPGTAGPVACNADGAIWCATQDTAAAASGAALWTSTDGTAWALALPGDVSFGQVCCAPEHLAFDGTRVIAAGPNVAATAALAAPPSQAFTTVQAGGMTVGTGTLAMYFSQPGPPSPAPNTAGNMLGVRLVTGDASADVTGPPGWELAADSGTGPAGAARAQIWLYRNAPGGIVGTTAGTAATFTCGNASAGMRGRLVERTGGVGTYQYIDQSGGAQGAGSDTTPGPVTAAGPTRVPGGLSMVMTGLVLSTTTGQTWNTAPTGWTEEAHANAVSPAWRGLTETTTFGATEQVTESLSLGATPAVMTSWAMCLATVWASPLHFTTAATLPAATAGAAYAQALAVAGNGGTVTRQLWAGALPPGLTFSATGLAGTPATPGTYPFTVLATDADGNMGYQAFTLTVTGGVSCNTTTLPDGAVGDTYSVTLQASGGTTPYTWALQSGALPTGVTLTGTGVNAGRISGTPAAGTDRSYSIRVRVTDNGGAYDEQDLTLQIWPAIAIVTAATLPQATIGEPYTTTLQATGGLVPYAWDVTSAPGLPSGLALDAPTGTITGTVTSQGPFTFTARVTSHGGNTASLALALVAAPPPAAPAVTDSLILAGQFELLGGGVISDHPACAGAQFVLGNSDSLDFDLGMPQPMVDLLASLSLDGEIPKGTRASNRTVTLPVTIRAPDRDILAAAREALWQAIDGQAWELVWAREGGLPLVFDCFRAVAATYTDSLFKDRSFVSTMGITFQALPYGRSTDLETLAFAADSTGWGTPAKPVIIDDFASVHSDTDDSQWFTSSQGITADYSREIIPVPYSARWSRRWRRRPVYAHTLPRAVNIGARAKISFWLGLGTTTDQYHVWHGGKVVCDVTLIDGAGGKAKMHATVHCACSGKQDSPAWTQITMAVPATTLFDPSTVTAYQITVWNTTDCDHDDRVLQAECYLSNLVAAPASVGIPQPWGAVYSLRGVLGTARAPLNIQVQPPPKQKQLWKPESDFTGTQTFTIPAGPVKLEVRAAGSGGGGGDPAGHKGGGGGPGGEYACEPAVSLPGSTNVEVTIGAAGAGGAFPRGTGGQGGDSYMKINGEYVVYAHAGPGGPPGSSTAGPAPGGTGSDATIHFDGGAGGAPQYGSRGDAEGSGGGSGGGQYQAGRPGEEPHDGYPGSGGVGGGGPGGTGGSRERPGQRPGSGYGGGGGGGDDDAAGGPGWNGWARITYGVQAGDPMTGLVVHKPGPGAPATLQPLVPVNTSGADIPNGNTSYPVTSPVPGAPARYAGTYTVVVGAQSWAGSAGTSRTVTVTVTQSDGITPPAGSTQSNAAAAPGRATSVSVSRTFTNAEAPAKLAVLGDITLPARDLAPDQAEVTYTVSITSTNLADVMHDVLLLDAEGSTVLVSSATTGWGNIWLDAATPDRALGQILGSTGERDSASSILDDVIVSGPPLSVEPGNNWLLCYSPSGAPAMFASYLPRYWHDRLR